MVKQNLELMHLVGVEHLGIRGFGTSATDECQSCNLSPSIGYTCTVLFY